MSLQRPRKAVQPREGVVSSMGVKPSEGTELGANGAKFLFLKDYSSLWHRHSVVRQTGSDRSSDIDPSKRQRQQD